MIEFRCLFLTALSIGSDIVKVGSATGSAPPPVPPHYLLLLRTSQGSRHLDQGDRNDIADLLLFNSLLSNNNK